MTEAENDVASSTKKLNLLAGVLGIAAFGLPFAAIGVQNNQLLFSTSAQQAELQGLLAKLTASEAEVTRAVAGAREMQGRAAVKMRDANAAMQQLQQNAPSK